MPQSQNTAQLPYMTGQPQYNPPSQRQPYTPQPQYSAQQTYTQSQASYITHQNAYTQAVPQYAASMPQQNPQSTYAPPVQGTQNIADAAATAAEEAQAAPQTEADEDIENENEKKTSTGTITALLIWFAFMAIAFAAVYFDVSGYVSQLFPEKQVTSSVTDSDVTNDISAGNDDAVPVTDALYGTWVMCTYYIQNMSDSSVTGGQHYTSSLPLQFYSFNSGTLDRCTGKTAADLSHEEFPYTFERELYSGSLLPGGSTSPVIALNDSYMCIYDTYEIDGVMCYVEFALLRVFDQPASNDAIIVYAEAIENSTVSLPQYASSIMNDATFITTSSTEPTAQITATYGVLGTWLFTERELSSYDSNGQPVGDTLVSSVANDTLNYSYVVFRLDGTYTVYSLKFSEDMSEVIEKSSEKGTYDFSDGLLSFAPASDKVSVTSGGGMMYFEYTSMDDGITNHIRESYKFISSDEYSYDELAKLRPDI